MAETDFDVIVVGSGCAGAVAAYTAASAGKSVLVVERGYFAGAKNMTGGRGFAEEADLQLMRDVAAKLGGECGCSRPLAEGVDWMPREAYIGVSGMMLAPKMYLGIGISGQMQHMVGVNHAGTMFAVNKDKNAPIFKQCDYGLVGDLKDVLPKLAAAL